MHKTLKGEAIRPPRSTLGAQQRAFTAFRHLYNEERPHQFLQGRPPAALYRRLANALKRHPVGLEEVADGVWSIHFCQVLLGRVDERDYIIRT